MDVGSSYPDFEYNSNLDELKYIYATSSGNLGEIAHSVLEDFPSLIPVSADFMQSENYSSFSVHNVENILENFQSGDRLLPWAHTYGENISGQSLDRPDRIFYMQWDNDGISAGYNTISHLLEGLSNIPNNFDDGISIKSFIQQNVPGLGLPNDIDYGLLFDFDYTAGGITINFSPYAMQHIYGDLEHADGIYEWDLFLDPFKILALQALSEGNNVSFQEKVINNLTGKALCIYEQIEDINGFRNILNAFQSPQSPAQVIFELENFLNDVNPDNDDAFAETIPPDSNDLIKIKLNSANNFFGVDGQPNLLVAQTIFHELLHAEFFRELVEAVGAGNYTQVTYDELFQALTNGNLFTLYDHIRRYNDWSHNFMANYFRETIARVTQEYDTGIAVPNNQQPAQLYLDLAWKGLRIDGEVQAWDDLAPAQQQAIDNVINNYTQNNLNQNCN